MSSKLTYKCTNLAYSGDDIIYKGVHHHINPSEDDKYWILYKYTYTGTNITKIQIREGSWTNRASADYWV